MSRFTVVDPREYTTSPFAEIGAGWMLICASDGTRTNAMTASWGGLGVLWGRNVATVYVRGSRYTKEFLDASDTFSLTFFDRPEYTEMLTYMGRTSGRTEDKIARAGLTVAVEDGVPYFDEARTAFLCRKLSRHPLSPDGFLLPEIDEKFYSDHDYHDMYIGEIEKILVRA